MSTQTTLSRLLLSMWLALSAGLPPTAALADEMVGLLRLELAGLTGVTGKVYLSVYDSADTWLGKDATQTAVLDIETNTEGEFVITDLQLPVGEYAISVFYDRNGNDKLDTNFIGVPKEPVALSNNAKAKLGPPKYRDAKFQLHLDPLILRITMDDV